MEESTTGLLNILNNTDIEALDDFIDEHGHSVSIGEFFSGYLYSHNIKSSDIVKKCQGYISKSYIYDLLNGKKTNPSRDNVILLCLAADMDFKHTRRTLEIFGHRSLYPKDSRDAIIAICINNKIFNIEEINDRLFEHGHPILRSDTAQR